MAVVLTEKRGAVLIVTINRPTVRNAIDGETADELVREFAAFDQDDSLSVAILTGVDGVFCSGADLKSIANNENPVTIQPDGNAPLGVSRMLLGKPVIAAVEGFAVAGGLELALWCDMRVAAEDAVFGVFCRRWGVPLVDGGTIRLPRLIGHSHALDMILTGRGVSGDEARMMGLANRLVPKGTALEHALELAESLTQFPQLCMRNDRLSSYEQWGMDWGEAWPNETRRGIDVLNSGETVAGASRFAGGAGRYGRFS